METLWKFKTRTTILPSNPTFGCRTQRIYHRMSRDVYSHIIASPPVAKINVAFKLLPPWGKMKKKNLYFKDGGPGHFWSNGKNEPTRTTSVPVHEENEVSHSSTLRWKRCTPRLTSAAHKCLSHTSLYRHYLFICLFPLLIWNPFKNRATFCSLLVISDLTAKLLAELVTMDQLSCRRILSVLPGNVSWHRDSLTWSKCMYFIDWDLIGAMTRTKPSSLTGL